MYSTMTKTKRRAFVTTHDSLERWSLYGSSPLSSMYTRRSAMPR